MTGNKAAHDSIPLDIETFAKLEAECKTRDELVYRTALEYCNLGWPILPCEYGRKSLVTASTLRKRGLEGQIKYEHGSANKDQITAWFHPDHGLFKGFNIGLACGTVVSAIDIDIKKDQDGWSEYVSRFGDPGRVPRARTPSGGVHLVVRAVPELGTTTNVVPGVDVRGCNPRTGASSGHILIYPSVIESKSGGKNKLEGYKWTSGGPVPEPDAIFMAHVARKVVDISKGRGNEEVDDADFDNSEVTLEEVRSCLDVIDGTDYDTWVKMGMAIHSVWPDLDGFDLWHDWSSTFDTYKGQRDCEQHWSSFAAEPQGIGINTLYYYAREQGWRREGEMSQQLKLELRYNDKGGLKKDHHNLAVILRSDDFAEAFGPLSYDDFQQDLLMGDTPCINQMFTKIAIWISTNFHLDYGFDVVTKAVEEAGYSKHSDALTAYAESLSWDGKDRLPDLYATLSASDSYQKQAVRRWLIGGIARALKPGCTSTHMLILYGAQGIGKSRFFRALCPTPAWFSDSTNFKLSHHSSARDEEMKLEGKWIVEVAELAGIWKSDFTDLKTFLSKQFDTVRKPYARDPVDIPRRVLFGGSTNNKQVLMDETGSRRFAFVNVEGKIDVEWVKENRDQLWAQARHLWDEGEQYWFTDEEMKLQEESNDEFQRRDPWEEKIGQWTHGKTRFTIGQVLEYGLNVPSDRWKPQDEKRVGVVLKTLGFEKTRIRHDGRRIYVYTDPAYDSEGQPVWAPSNEVEDY